jgi:hypothetical protein
LGHFLTEQDKATLRERPDRHQAAHAMNLFDMHEKYADVLQIDEVVEHLESLATKEPVSA